MCVCVCVCVCVCMCVYSICDSTLKVGNKLLLHKLKCSIVSRAILIGEITTHKFTKILFCCFCTWWQSSYDNIDIP